MNKYLESAILLNSLINTATDNGLFPITEKSGSEIYSLISRIDAAMTETSVRVEKNERLSQYIYDAQEHIDNGIRRDYDEYYQLNNALSEAMALDMISATNDEVDAECEQLFSAITLYYAKVSGWQAMTARIKSLRTLAQELGSDIVYNSSLNQIVDNLQTDDDEIAEIYKTAIMIEIYRYLMDDPYAFEDGLDITPFIKNYNLYVTNYEPYVDNRDLTLGTGSDRNNERAKGYNNPGSSIMWIGHYYGQDYLDNKIWVLMYDTEYSNVFPGWTVQSFASGFGMASPDPTASKYDYLRYGAPQFDGSLMLDWNSKAELKTTIEGIPNGCYSLGVKAEIDASSSARSTIKSITKVYDYDSIICNEITYDYNGTIMLDNIPVLDGEMNIELSLQSNDGFTKVDDFSLFFYGDYYYVNYSDKISELETELNYMLNGYPNVDTYSIYMDDVSCEAGSQVVIPIRMQNSSDVTAFSLDVRLPSGITFVSANLASGRANGHSLSSNISNQWSYSTVSLACMSTENNALIGYDGTVVYLTVNVSSDIEGDFSILLDNIEVTSLPIMKQNPYSYTGTVSVSAYVMPGDVYVDGSITITDAVGIVAFIINSNTQGLNRRAADANQDGVIDVSDVVWVINKVIHKSYAPRRGPAATVSPSQLILDYSVTGNKMSIPVRIEGVQNEMTAAQFCMTLPEGISLSGATTDNNHMVFIQKQEDGTYMIACISLNNSTFSAAEEAALTLDFEFSKSFDGEEVLLNNIIMATPDGLKTYIDNVICRLSSEGGQTGVRVIESDNDAEMFDLQGRAIDKANGIYIRNGQKRIQIK